MRSFDTLQAALDDLRAGRSTTAEFCRTAGAPGVVPATLPPRYGEVLRQLLDRLEASALFTEESCSFSQRDLLDGVQAWIDKARAAAAAA